ncbi:GATA zinc finger domain-containing protein 10-like [Adelges cooleyi]|uniref:GATA zinc finger domain-containing protein 10-like n=1 Tax=Adelges cooleyi TaxID=133065 RepID=UPI00217F6390|nr:GATA zinc finger domain-containing protein 10-like [Adelges cooleyi]XP_050419712.1 GATA zinc finger domain-containing protein 10-like [Adelges cooleyi]
MLQQYQQQPDYTPYGGMGGYGAQPNSGYFNYAGSESSWFNSPSAGDQSQMHGGLSHNACSIGDNGGHYMNHGYHHSPTTGATGTSSVESFASTGGHGAAASQQPEMDPMADFLNHQNIDENDKIKEESIDWLSTIINDDGTDHRPDDVKLAVGELPAPAAKSQESNGRLPNFHQAFGSTEIGRFSQHEYYEPPKDAPAIGGECGPPQPVVSQQSDEPVAPQPPMSYELPRQPSRRGRGQRGGGQHRRNKNSRTSVAAAAAAAAAQQYVGYDMAARHQSPYSHQDPYNGRSHHQQRYPDQQYHQHHHQQQHPAAYQSHEYYRQQQQQQQQHQQQHQQHQQQQQYDRMHHYQPPTAAAASGNQYYGQREQYAAGYNRFHSCCSTENIARPNHQSYGGGGGGGGPGPGQYYGEYNAYNQW